MSEGYRSLTGRWVGGLSSTPPPDTNGGFRSVPFFWLGGLGATPPGGGYRSPVGFWLGGLSALPYTAPAPTLDIDGDGLKRRIIRNKIRKDINDDDDIIIEVSKAFLGLVQ